MKIKESCACGGEIVAKGEAPGDAVERWRKAHVCDRRPPATLEQADARVEQPVGFTVQP